MLRNRLIPDLRAAFVPAILLAAAWQAQAVQWTLLQTGPPVWAYTLTFAPEDNYSVFQGNTTITMSGLTGVTAAGAPSATDFPNPYPQLTWTPTVTNGGTTVVWTKVGGGTGNFDLTLHVYGFNITAAGATNGTVSFATSGMSRDSDNPLPGGGFNLDISGTVAGPTSPAGTASAPALSPLALLLTSLGLGLAGAWEVRSRFLDRLRHGG